MSKFHFLFPRERIRQITVGLGLMVALPMIGLAEPSSSEQEIDFEFPFGKDFSDLDVFATGEWWKKENKSRRGSRKNLLAAKVPRDEVIAFAVYTQDRGILKLTAQLFPLMPDEERSIRLQMREGDQWKDVATETIIYPGWSAHFRLEDWDDSKEVPYRLLHGEKASFEGLIRRNPIDQGEISVAVLSCNSSKTPGPRSSIVQNLIKQDPDLLFFAGDQSYQHQEATMGWIDFGLQFREVLRDRPTITIPDDHDVGHGNLWGENGKRSERKDGTDGGYKYPASFVNMVQRQQTWHLPDPVDPDPVEQGIGVYFTNYLLGGIDFAIIEDRKFKSGPLGKIPEMGPRPDHINDPSYDRNSIDLPDLELLGARQEAFLQDWSQDWTGAEMKVVLSATPFCGAVHLHGKKSNRLLADLDCNGWPQSKRNEALRLIRQAKAVHLCGDQHIGLSVKHGIDDAGDGPFTLVSPAIANTIYGRWWHPLDEKPGPNSLEDSPLPWTGDYEDGLGNKIRMLAYANQAKDLGENSLAEGYGMVRFDRADRSFTFECWKRFTDLEAADAQYPGWPLTYQMSENDGRKVTGYLPALVFPEGVRPVIQVIDEASQEILYTERAATNRYQPAVYSEGPFTIKVGRDRPEKTISEQVNPQSKEDAGAVEVALD